MKMLFAHGSTWSNFILVNDSEFDG